MTDWAAELYGTGKQMQQHVAQPTAPEKLPEFWDLVPNPASLAPGLPSFLGGQPKKPPASQWDIPPETIQKLINAGAMSQDDEQLADIIKQDVPDAKFYDGGDGRVVVDIQGKKAYLNAPGFSPQDLVRGTTAGTSVALAASPMGAALKGAPYLARVGGAMLAGGAGSAVQDVAANQFGAEKIVDPERLALNMAAGGVAEGILQPIIGAGYRFIVSRGKGMYDAAAGKLTDAGRRVLQQLGANADEISDDLARQFAAEARGAANPAQALRSAEGKSLPVPVIATRGQTTLRPQDQMFEDQAYKGTYGAQASQVMQSAEQAQQQALRGNIPVIQQQLAGSARPIGSGEGAAAAQARLVEMRGAEKSAARRLYDTAREASAAIPQGAGLDGSRAIKAAVEEGHVLTGLSRTNSVIKQFDDIVSQSGESINSQVSINKLFDWRKQATAAARGNAENEEGVAIGKAIKAFDDWVGQTVDDALVAGDDTAVALWKQAIGNYKEFAGRFKGGNMIQALTQKAPRGGEMQLKVAPEDAANYILGASDSGWIAKPNLARDLMRMKQMLGEKSDAWNGIRQEIFLRLARSGEGQMQGGTRMFSGANFKKVWDSMLEKNPTLMNSIFSAKERGLITQFSNVAARITNPVKGGQNFSNTASALTSVAQKLAGRLGPVVGKWFMQTKAGNAINIVKASEAAKGIIPRPAVGVGSGTPFGPAAVKLYQDSDRR